MQLGRSVHVARWPSQRAAHRTRGLPGVRWIARPGDPLRAYQLGTVPLETAGPARMGTGYAVRLPGSGYSSDPHQFGAPARWSSSLAASARGGDLKMEIINFLVNCGLLNVVG